MWPDGAAGGDHQHQEAADPEHLEGGVDEGPGPEPGHPLHPLHDEGESQHARGRDSDTGGDNLQQMMSQSFCFYVLHLSDAISSAGLGETRGVSLVICEGHPLPELDLPHQWDVDTV